MLDDVIAIAAGYSTGTALRSDGTVWRWGYNNNGWLGDGTETNRSTPVQSLNVTNAIAIGGSEQHTLVLTADGRVWAWGSNLLGGVGDGTFITRGTPALIPDLSDVVAIDSSVGYTVSHAIKSDGSLWEWGSNLMDPIDDGTSSYALTPALVAWPE